ncbi:unnamed protein product [marine sediment metagenome]|uniref:Uncharacterized protein n=1 Tax=marine sediment metagenome TaxID=412755 RepID=X1LUK0_9ZZZZ
MEVYRYLIDDFLIEYCKNLKANDFVVKTESLGRIKQGKREYLNNRKTKELIGKLNNFFESTIDIPRIKVGKKQTIATLINEEALQFAKYLRSEM